MISGRGQWPTQPRPALGYMWAEPKEARDRGVGTWHISFQVRVKGRFRRRFISLAVLMAHLGVAVTQRRLWSCGVPHP